MGFLRVDDLAYAHPGGDLLFSGVSFRVRDGSHTAIVGPNGVGKSTLMRIVAGELEADEGDVTIEGRLARMDQAIGEADPTLTIRGFLVELSPPQLRAAGRKLIAAEAVGHATSTEAAIDYANALHEWGDAEGYTAESLWDDVVTNLLRRPYASVADRPVTTLSGGERKQLALELLFRGDADILLLDEPDNYLDTEAKLALEARIRASKKTILLISHDRELMASCIDRIVTLEAGGAWAHEGSYTTYPEARQTRIDQLGDELQRWNDEERRLFRFFKLMKQRALQNPGNAPRADAAESRWQRYVDAGPPPAPPPKQSVTMRLTGGDSTRIALRWKGLTIPGLFEPWDDDIRLGERVAVMGGNGTGKSHFLRSLLGREADAEGAVELGNRVEPGWFSQTNAPTDLDQDKPLLSVLIAGGDGEQANRALLGRYGLHRQADFPFRLLSGGQKARFQILPARKGRGQLPAARRADRQPRSGIVRGARGGARRVHRQRAGRHPRPGVRPWLRPGVGVRPQG